MRDPRMIAIHRGGLLERKRHRRLAAWAADCAERVLPLFEADRNDPRPRRALDVARAWARGETTVGAAQRASVAAHAAARAAGNPAALAAARAAGHAVATAHMADHSLGAVIYALKALAASGAGTRAEFAWQIRRLPAELRTQVREGLKQKTAGRLG